MRLALNFISKFSFFFMCCRTGKRETKAMGERGRRVKKLGEMMNKVEERNKYSHL